MIEDTRSKRLKQENAKESKEIDLEMDFDMDDSNESIEYMNHDKLTQECSKNSKESDDMKCIEAIPNRQENTLSMLTTGFLNLIKTKPDRIINLNEAAEELNVKKRRLYDVTNVLEGVGYLIKVRKNEVQYLGSVKSDIRSMNCQASSFMKQALKLEKQIDKVTDGLFQQFRKLTTSEKYKKYMYVYAEDIQKEYLKEGESIILLDTSANTKISIPYNYQQMTQDPEKIQQIVFTNDKEAINLQVISKADPEVEKVRQEQQNIAEKKSQFVQDGFQDLLDEIGNDFLNQDESHYFQIFEDNKSDV